MRGQFPTFQQRGKSQQLVILLHGFNKDHRRMIYVGDVVAVAFPDADILAPDLEFGLCSTTPTAKVVNGLLEKVDEVWNESVQRGSPYERIILVGHSMGGLFARKLYVCACGEHKDAPFDKDIEASEPREWAGQVERIILLAGMNRGWTINHHLNRWTAVSWMAGLVWGNILKLFKGEPLIFTIRRGAVFITELRVQWLLMRQAAAANEGQIGHALTIQLLGSVDDLVAPGDNIDLVSGSDFLYLDVPFSGHLNILDMDDSHAGQGRADVFRSALIDSPEELRKREVIPADNPQGEPRPEVTDVVFVLHGIRDEGHWTHKVARRVRELGKVHNREIATETSSYGYFPMLSFLYWGERQAKTQWFMDQYVEARSRYPNATFYFVGHSNGTYLLANALAKYSCCRFERVVFAGSVVHRRYDWARILGEDDDKQVKGAANYVATADWVVAYFPKSFQMLGVQDLGSAGHDGFESELVSQVKYVRGPHGAAIQESNWDEIATFILNGGDAKVEESLQAGEADRKWWVVYPSYVAPLVPLTILCLVLAGLATPFVVLLYIYGGDWSKIPNLATLSLGVYSCLFVYIVWSVLMKV